jgi:hypothetical protein
MVLTYDAYTETLESQRQKDNEFEILKEQLNSLSKNLFEAGILKKD